MTNELDEAERSLRQAVSHLAQCPAIAREAAWTTAVEAIGAYVAVTENVRKRLDPVEDLWHQEQQAHTAAVTRAEQAEGQQRSDFAKMQEWRERAERAEADNAAIVKDVQCRMEKCGCTSYGPDDICNWCDAMSTAVDGMDGASHPGAVLMERMRALEEVRKACEPYCAEEGATNAETTSERGWELVLACAAYDALKPETK